MICTWCTLRPATEWHVAPKKDHVMAICADCHASLHLSFPCAHGKERELLAAVGAPPEKGRVAT